MKRVLTLALSLVMVLAVMLVVHAATETTLKGPTDTILLHQDTVSEAMEITVVLEVPKTYGIQGTLTAPEGFNLISLELKGGAKSTDLWVKTEDTAGKEEKWEITWLDTTFGASREGELLIATYEIPQNTKAGNYTVTFTQDVFIDGQYVSSETVETYSTVVKIAQHKHTMEQKLDDEYCWIECSECGYKANKNAHKDAAPSIVDHKCDYGCGYVMGECADSNDANHTCDHCGKVIESCYDDDANHKCDECGETTSTCVDSDKNHECDYEGCKAAMGGECKSNKPACVAGECDYCGKDYPATEAHDFSNGDCVCGEKKPGMKGDFDGDGEVTAEDLTLLARHVAGIEDLVGDALANADVNSDGEIDSSDLTDHARYVAGIIKEWP